MAGVEQERITLSFTGPDSHVLVLEAGVGNVIVGPAGSRPAPDLVVTPDAHPDWTVFEGMTTRSGYSWPRGVHYTGTDPGLFDWARGGRVEDVVFVATGTVDLDARGFQLTRVTVATAAHRVGLALPRVADRADVVLRGDPSLFELVPAPDGIPEAYRLDFRLPAGGSMPPMPGFAALRRIGVRNGPGAPPFDVRGLRQFPQLAHVTLEGALTGLEALADLPLVGLGFRLVPDLGGLPSLASWPELQTFSAVDSDAATARRLRAEHRGPVTRPRERAWFLEEYGLPFGAWPTRTARAATKAFRAASAEIRAAADRDAGLAVIEGFTRAANGFGGIETVQREDLATAVALLAGLADPPLDTATAIARFDAVRDF